MLIDIETALPPFRVSQKFAAEKLKIVMGNNPVVSRMIDAISVNSGIEYRYTVVANADNSLRDKFYFDNDKYLMQDTKARMHEYEFWSKTLSIKAVDSIISKNKIDVNNIGKIVTVSCTGFFAPGIDCEIIKHFSLPTNIKRTNIGFMGCAAAITGFNSVFDTIKCKPSESVLMIAVELCSLHLQNTPTKDNLLASMLFADGCAAAFFSNNKVDNKTAVKIIKTHTMLFDSTAEYMGWKIGNYGFEMILSNELPKLIFEYACPSLCEFLKENNIDLKSIKHWALHPGGRAIIDSLQKGLNLTDEQTEPSRKILRDYGNMSSPSILFVLKELLNKIKKDELCCAVAFGPGLTMEVALMKGV
ncbi:type III polyketide synthase [Melioribacteraceae bacterium 4301-Me]|uniref:type III polyketide synthase n=1 Tax=Pyranulibacter aquaticus TaxID=3163344 RepID=UPI00359A2084